MEFLVFFYITSKSSTDHSFCYCFPMEILISPFLLGSCSRSKITHIICLKKEEIMALYVMFSA
jgi:hypothetical protein